jgi:hypothetical protein
MSSMLKAFCKMINVELLTDYKYKGIPQLSLLGKEWGVTIFTRPGHFLFCYEVQNRLRKYAWKD